MAKIILICFISSSIDAQPVIHSLLPLSGSTGSTVTISGNNFDPIAANNIVYFGAVKAKIISSSATTLTVSVPVGASYEPVTVTTNHLTAISDKPFTVTFGCAGNLSPSSFIGPYSMAGAGVYNIRTTDMDGDGKTDIVYSSSSSIVVLLNNSSLTTVSFTHGATIAANCCFKFDIADVDGDGKKDLIAPNSCNDLVSVVKNNSVPGALSFASPINYATGDFPYAVVVSNVDGDGKPDLAVVNMDGNTLSVFKNASSNGVISFVGKTDYPIGNQCRAVATADLDGDGKPDLAVTSQSNQYVSLFRNLSTVNTIVLSSKQDISTPTGAPEDVVIADYDGDGKPDLAVSNNNIAGSISVYKNLSTPGSFSFSSMKNFLTGAYPFRMAAADLNGDGKPDMVVKDQYTSTLTLLENNSSAGNLSFASKVDIPSSSPNREHTTIGDFNGDGKPDIAVSNGSSILIFLNNPAVLSITADYTIPTCSEYDGTITAKALGGQPPYQYKLGTLPYQSSGDFTKVPPGTHLVRVKDASGCVDSVTVILPSNYLWFSISVTDANCNQNNGSISISGSGTNLPLSYSLDNINFQSTTQFNNLAAGIYNVYVKDNGGCTNQSGFIVGSACMSIEPIVTKTTCGFANGVVEIQASGGVAPYQYSLDGVQYTTNKRFTSLTAKDYTMYAKDASGKIVSTTVTVGNIAGPVLSSVEIINTDCNSSTGTATIIAQGGTAPFQYVLNAINFQSSPTFSSLSAGSYKLTVNDANGCFDSRTVDIPVNNNLTIDMGQDLTICEGSNVTLTGNSNGTGFSWSPTTGLNNSSILIPVASPSTTTTYVVTASLGTCTKKDTITIKVRPAPIPNAGTDISICPEQTILLKGSGGVSYSWSPSFYLSDANSSTPLFSGAPKGNYVYSLNVTDADNCRSLKPATVKISVSSPLIDAGRDTIIQANNPIQLNAKDPGNYGFIEYDWTPLNGLNNPSVSNPVLITDRDVVYTVTAKTQDGCTATDNISIKVYNGINIYVPTAFSPNNDGKNDILKAIPVGIKEFRYLKIYNRWGQLVFQTNDASKGWNGKLNGLLQTGVVVWFVEGIDYLGHLVRKEGTTVIIQ
jgi:gliding motility-associated-like protein